MKKVVILKHIDSLKNSREFFLMKIPKTVNCLFLLVVSFFIICLTFVCFIKIDEVVKVNGVVRTLENVSTVKNIIPGRIIEKNYEPGKFVSKGELLYRIDSTVYESQRENLLINKDDLQNKFDGIILLINSYKKNRNLVPKEQDLFYTKFETYLTQKKELTIKKDLAKLLYEEEKNNPPAIRNQKNIKLKKIDYDLASNNLDYFCNSFISNLYTEKNELEISLENVTTEIEKLEKTYENLNIFSPMDGYVQELSSLNVDDYIASDLSVLSIVPNDLKNFKVELQIAAKDIGKIKEGMKVKYRLSAFPFFEYKGANGIIQSMDADVRTSQNTGRLYYIVYADIDRINFSDSKGNSYPIKAGLETDARIVLEQNRLIYYILKKIDFIN